MRHAKAAAQSPSGQDHDRPLARRGQVDAGFMAEILEQLGWSPAQVVSSDAMRTRQTWMWMSQARPLPVQVELHRGLYLAGLSAIQRVARGWDSDQKGPVLVLGHNPGWEMAASQLSGQQIGMTTANAILLTGEGPSWSAALHKPWKLVHQLVPKHIRAHGLD